VRRYDFVLFTADRFSCTEQLNICLCDLIIRNQLPTNEDFTHGGVSPGKLFPGWFTRDDVQLRELRSRQIFPA